MHKTTTGDAEENAGRPPANWRSSSPLLHVYRGNPPHVELRLARACYFAEEAVAAVSPCSHISVRVSVVPVQDTHKPHSLLIVAQCLSVTLSHAAAADRGSTANTMAA